MCNEESLIHDLTRELAAEGAHAVLLFGSFARGDASPYSDLDLWALGSGAPRYELRAGRLIVATWAAPGAVRAEFHDPATVCQAIPVWREARILFDPDGCAADLQGEALVWSWEALDPAACAAHVAREIAGLAEETLKLAGALAADRPLMAAVQRNVLVLRLAGVMALHGHLFYSTENRLWDALAAALGDPWAGAQARAFGLEGVPFETSCRAALELYALAAHAARDDLNETQYPIVAHASALAGYALD
jgi:hypothetical protein